VAGKANPSQNVVVSFGKPLAVRSAVFGALTVYDDDGHQLESVKPNHCGDDPGCTR